MGLGGVGWGLDSGVGWGGVGFRQWGGVGWGLDSGVGWGLNRRVYGLASRWFMD